MNKETVLIYLHKDKQTLMLYRNGSKDDLNKNKWLGIGGKIENNESPDDAVKREVKEETNLDLHHFTKRGIIYFSDTDYEEVMHLYTSESFSGILSNCDEGMLKWIDQDKIFDLPIWEGDIIFLNKLFKDKEYFTLQLKYEHSILMMYKFGV